MDLVWVFLGLSSMLPHAACNPYDQVIEIPNSKPNVLLYPSCVVLKQCGGCCGHPDLMCKPTETAVKKVQVSFFLAIGGMVRYAWTSNFGNFSYQKFGPD